MIYENIISASVITVIALALSLAPLIYGAAKKRGVIKPTEYLPPRGASPLDVLILYYGARANAREIFNPLMLYWAERGFITIEEDCKRGLKLTKLKDLTPPSGGCFNEQTFEIEKKLFGCLFPGKVKTFYTLAASEIYKKDYEEIIDACEEPAKEITHESCKKLSVLSMLSGFAMLFAVGLITAVSLDNSAVFLLAFTFIAIAVLKFALTTSGDDGGDLSKGSAARFFLVPFLVTFGGIPFAVLLSFVPLSAGILLSVAVALCIITVFAISPNIDVRTEEQLKDYARICGFKRFLLLAEVGQLEALVEDDPRYYYNILPYCYVLKITEKLKPKFDAVALDGPAWYLGELRDTLMF